MATLIKAAWLIDGTGGPVVADPAVLVAEGRIVSIGRGDERAWPSSAEVLDMDQATLLPGLIDSHVHLGLCRELGYERGQMQDNSIDIALRAARNARDYLFSGATAVRCAGDKDYIDMACQRAIDGGYVVGPRIFPCGPGIRSTHGHGATATCIADGADAVRLAVREHLNRNVHHLKLFITGGTGTIGTTPTRSYYTRAEIAACIEEAHQGEKVVMAHVHGGPGATDAIEAGLDSLEHGAYLTDEQLELMCRAGTWLVPTLCGSFHDDAHAPGSVPPPTEVLVKRERAREKRAALLPKVARSPIRVAAGTDTLRGMLWFELELMVRFGYTHMQAILAATRWGAELLGEWEDIGSVAPGKRADLIAVQGDPLADIRCLRAPVMVMKDGVRYV